MDYWEAGRLADIKSLTLYSEDIYPSLTTPQHEQQGIWQVRHPMVEKKTEVELRPG
jgi:hypothetical protein